MPVLWLPSNDLGGLTFAFVRSAGNIFGGGTSAVATLGGTPVTGDLVIVCQGSDGASTVSSVTSTSATWTKAVGAAGGEIWYSTNVTTAAITVNLSAGDSGGFTVLHFTGNLVASPLDGTPTTATAFSGSAAPGSVTPTADNYLAVACVGAAGATATGTPASYTAQAAQADGAVNERCAFWIQTTATATNPTWTLSGTTTWRACVAIFKHG